MARSTKSENKTVAEKATKVLSDKKQTELDHLQGKHRESIINDCSFCKRRNVRDRKKIDRTKAFFAGQKK